MCCCPHGEQSNERHELWAKDDFSAKGSVAIMSKAEARAGFSRSRHHDRAATDPGC